MKKILTVPVIFKSRNYLHLGRIKTVKHWFHNKQAKLALLSKKRKKLEEQSTGITSLTGKD